MKNVFVVGAGPAGLFAAQKIAVAGHRVFVFNRDIKPGGLAEYGIYPLKDKMKGGLRKQFAKVLAMPNVHYFGNVKIGAAYDVTLDDLARMAPSAVVFACGAQGYNRLNLPGEDARGVYSAKDFVYHYNQLPPFATEDFSAGKRIAVIGMGNVALDIARWLLVDSPARRTEEVTIIARRGPWEAKFDEKEMAHVEAHLDRTAFARELERDRTRCETCGQDVSIEKLSQATFPALLREGIIETRPKLTFRFLSSPKEIVRDATGRIRQMVVTENDLVLRSDGNTGAKATGRTAVIDVDTLIFAIGEKHDPGLGLPMGADGFSTRSDPAHPEEPAYEVWDPVAGKRLDGFYVAGWARRASTGLAGIARHDGENAAARVIQYVDALPDKPQLCADEIQAILESKGAAVVNKDDLFLLDAAAEREAQRSNLAYFKYSSNAGMLNAIAEEKRSLAESRSSANWRFAAPQTSAEAETVLSNR
ncbi:MAG: FAD-dependent oxidoreductase [Acidobacteriaceae bacterium]